MSGYIDKVFFKSSAVMSELPDCSVQLAVTSPPYFNVKDYSKDGYQNDVHSEIDENDIGRLNSFDAYINSLLPIWKECARVLKPNPRNFYAQNSCEFILVLVKDGKPDNNIPEDVKEASKLSQSEWVEYTKQIWNIPIPGKGDIAFGEHSAIMPEEMARRLIKLYSFQGELVLDPFTGSGTTLRAAKELNRHYVGYELYEHYRSVISQKLTILCAL
ncbi:MAG: site-specific DNA-methyltransferase [Deferribacteraceae bacterium]|nr:site-specific DNA-methyltransferase [Deferribacteraceae bacterium]